MKLWLLRNVEPAIWDSYRGHVIRAKTETVARQLASKMSGDEGPDLWLNSNKSTCVPFTSSGEEEIILSSFRAG